MFDVNYRKILPTVILILLSTIAIYYCQGQDIFECIVLEKHIKHNSSCSCLFIIKVIASRWHYISRSGKRVIYPGHVSSH